MDETQASNCLTLVSLLGEIGDGQWDFLNAGGMLKKKHPCCAIGRALRNRELFRGLNNASPVTIVNAFGRRASSLFWGDFLPRSDYLGTPTRVSYRSVTRRDFSRRLLDLVHECGWEEAQ